MCLVVRHFHIVSRKAFLSGIRRAAGRNDTRESVCLERALTRGTLGRGNMGQTLARSHKRYLVRFTV